MGNALVREDTPAEFPTDAQEFALRQILEEARRIAAQSRLLALNAAMESASACGEPVVAREMDALGGSAGRTVAEMERVAASVELLLQQINSASALSRPL